MVKPANANKSKSKFQNSFVKFIRKNDFFGQAMPGFNLQGERTIKSNLGSALTLICSAVALIYAITKASHLQSISGQTVSQYTEYQETSPDNPLNLNDRNFRIAFSFEESESRKFIYDPRYVRWIFRLATYKDDEIFETILPYHICTDEDYDEFYPIRAS